MRISRPISSILLLLLCFNLVAQSQKDRALKNFTYLNFNNSLSGLVSIDNEGVKIFSSSAAKAKNTPEFTLFWPETEYFVNLTYNLEMDSLVAIYKKKGNTRMGKAWMPISFPELNDNTNTLPLNGKKIAIDPGHIAGSLETGRIEQKFLYFLPNEQYGLEDTIAITEGLLTWQTAKILKDQLEKQGATVFMTRKEAEQTAFGISYEEWMKTRRKPVLDSLLKVKKISSIEYKKYMNLNKEKFFWEFFRDHELAQRIRAINKFRPDVTAIIHYNVDEKNTDWLHPGAKDFSMCFIGGGMTADNFQKIPHKINFLRLLVSDDINNSELLSGFLVKEFKETLKVPVAKKKDATYLEENCIATGTEGVYCRNLALCRGVASALVYGECLYQDNIAECKKLANSNKLVCGIKTSERVEEVATSYYKAIMNYFEMK